ncbi:MAG: hypothetical protein WKF28_10350 [Rubrobacteraceae bacterium]|nr:hypothetical protein [Rubrobacter sp.]
MATRARGLRISKDIEEEIEREMRLRGTTFSEVATGLLREAIRMRRVPGVVFMEGPAGRRSVLAGTGLDAWEVISTYKSVDGDYERLKRSYEWLSESQLSAALDYYALYPEEIDARIEREEWWTPERVRRELPFTRRGVPGTD